MTNETETREQEVEYIKNKWGYDKIVERIDNPRNRRWKIRELEMECAFNASQTSPLKEAVIHGTYFFAKAILTAIPALALAYGARELFNNEDINTVEKIGIAGISSPVSLGLLALTRLGLYGNHPVSGYGNYFEEPTFGLVDNLRFGINWLKIAGMQMTGKIKKGDGKLAKKRLDYSIHGGP